MSFRILLALVSLVIAACTFHFFWTAITAPEKLSYNVPRQDGKTKFLNYAYLFAVFIGTAVCLYHGAIAALSWMPHSWVSTDEDGNSEWLAATFAGIIALVGAIGLLDGLGNAANKRVELEQELDEFRREKWGQKRPQI